MPPPAPPAASAATGTTPALAPAPAAVALKYGLNTPGMGAAPRTMIRIGDDNRAPLDLLCNKLIAAGGACVVIRNQMGRTRLSADASPSDATPSRGKQHTDNRTF